MRTRVFLLSFIIVSILISVWSEEAKAMTSVSFSYENGPKPINNNSANPWIPTGVSDRTPPPECQAKTLEYSLLGHGLNGPTNPQRGRQPLAPNAAAPLIKDFFQRCEKILAKYGLHHILSLTRLERALYRFEENPNIRQVRFTITDTYPNGFINNEVIRGVAAFKPDNKPRPLILIKCGLFCSVSSSTLFRNLLMHGFDENPFNLIILNSNSSTEYYLDNNRISLGGFDEGKQIITIANWLKASPEFSSLISSLHVIGVSNGGHAALFAAAYNPIQQALTGTNSISSVTALCPVINLSPSFSFIFERSLLRSLFTKQFWETIQEVYDFVPSLQPLVDRTIQPAPHEFPGIIANAALDYYKNLPSEWFWPPLAANSIQTTNEIWKINNFSQLASTIQTPTFIWSPHNDSVINFSENGASLKAELASHSNPNIDLLDTPYGNHCAYSLAYGWSTLSTIFRAQVLSNSPEFGKNYSVSIEPISIPTPSLAENERHISQEWSIQKGDNFFTLKLKIWNRQASFADMCNTNPFDSPESCYTNRIVQIPFSALSIPNLEIPNSDTSAQVLSRRMNSEVELLDENKIRLTDSQGSPSFLRLISYY